MVRIEEEVEDFLNNRMSKSLNYSEKILFLARIGIELFDIIDDLKSSIKKRS